jgi:hypothetical protein
MEGCKLLILWSGRRGSNPRMGYGALATDGDEKWVDGEILWGVADDGGR